MPGWTRWQAADPCRSPSAPEFPADEAADLAVFLDMDLSSPGAPEADFDAYEDGVRYEYRDA